MGRLLNLNTENHVILRPQHLFGRHPASVNTVLNELSVSGLHASISWNGSQWVIQDTSSNGTFINGVVMVTGSKKRLKKRDTIQFGSPKAAVWLVDCDDPPKSLLVPLAEINDPIEIEGMVVLPNEQAPEITLYQDNNEQWLMENQMGIDFLKSGTKITTKDQSWVFIDANTLEATLQADHKQFNDLSEIQLNFTVSKNEEHVSLMISIDDFKIDLNERAHHYLLLSLARKRLTDRQKGIENDEQGWVDKDILCQETGLDEKYINLQIYRFRKQLIHANPQANQLLQIIERRRGEIRCAVGTILIKGGNT